MKSVIRNNKNYICAICAWIAMYVIDILYAVKNYYYLINSDTASEMILGNELAKNGGLLSKAWYYSTELRVLNTQIFYKIAFLISPSKKLLLSKSTNLLNISKILSNNKKYLFESSNSCLENVFS